MKKIVSIIVFLACSLMYVSAQQHPRFFHDFLQSAETRYDLSVDMRRLAVTLDLTGEQEEFLTVVNEIFSDNLHSASELPFFLRHREVMKSVHEAAVQSKRFLSEEQFETYMMLLVTTVRNKHI